MIHNSKSLRLTHNCKSLSCQKSICLSHFNLGFREEIKLTTNLNQPLLHSTVVTSSEFLFKLEIKLLCKFLASSLNPALVVEIKPLLPEEIDNVLESSKPGTTLVRKGKGTIKGHGRDSFRYSRVQVMGASGNTGSAIDDQNFSATPTIFPGNTTCLECIIFVSVHSSQ